MSLFRNLFDAATGRVLRFNNAKKTCMKELFVLAEGCINPAILEPFAEPDPMETAFRLVVIGFCSPIRWFSEIQCSGPESFRRYSYFDNAVQFQHVIGSMQCYFWRSLQIRAKSILEGHSGLEQRLKAARINRFFGQDDGLSILLREFVPKLYGTSIDPGQLSFEQVFDPYINVQLDIHNRLFRRYAELRGISMSDEHACDAWLRLVNSTREDVFELTDYCYRNFDQFYADERKWACSTG